MGLETLYNDIHNSLHSDPFTIRYIENPELNPQWKLDNNGLLWCDNRIYIPDGNDLHLKVLQYKHDHILSGHYGHNKTLHQVRQEYVWPEL